MADLRKRADALAAVSGVIRALNDTQEEVSTSELKEMFNEQLEERDIESDVLKVE